MEVEGWIIRDVQQAPISNVERLVVVLISDLLDSTGQLLCRIALEKEMWGKGSHTSLFRAAEHPSVCKSTCPQIYPYVLELLYVLPFFFARAHQGGYVHSTPISP